MSERTFLTVPLASGSRASVNLDRVLQIVETPDGTAFIFDTGTVLQTKQDYDAVDRRYCTELPPMAEADPLVDETARQLGAKAGRHPWLTYPRPLSAEEAHR